MKMAAGVRSGPIDFLNLTHSLEHWSTNNPRAVPAWQHICFTVISLILGEAHDSYRPSGPFLGNCTLVQVQQGVEIIENTPIARTTSRSYSALARFILF